MNLVLWGEGSSGAVPFSTLIALLALWFGVSVPLTFVGAYFGFRKRVSYKKACFFGKVIKCKHFVKINELQIIGVPKCSYRFNENSCRYQKLNTDYCDISIS